MARKKESTFTSWDEVNQAMKNLGEKQIQVEKLEGEQTIKINLIKEAFELKAGDIKSQIKEIEENILLFAEANKAEFLKDRTKKLTFGNISFRITESLTIKNIASTVAALKNLKLTEYLRMKAEPDKEALKGLDDSTLVKFVKRPTKSA